VPGAVHTKEVTGRSQYRPPAQTSPSDLGRGVLLQVLTTTRAHDQWVRALLLPRLVHIASHLTGGRRPSSPRTAREQAERRGGVWGGTFVLPADPATRPRQATDHWIGKCARCFVVGRTTADRPAAGPTQPTRPGSPDPGRGQPARRGWSLPGRAWSASSGWARRS
jgi:hypothetical protein